jgi:antitoxin (DNA-binding transcriptional repressor) of toxin-antitoxin stability system
MASTSVNVTELRSRLRSYLSRVRNGEEILIRDRKLAVARLVPLSPTNDFDEELQEMAARGLVRLPEKKLDLRSFFALPAPRIPLSKLRAAIEAERDED